MVCVSDMDKVETDCHELIETIAAVLDNGNIQRLFVSTQRNNLGTCHKVCSNEVNGYSYAFRAQSNTLNE